MCRSIKTLRGQEHTDEDVRAAALQFVRKISGYRNPSRANQAVFDGAVDEITQAAGRLLTALTGEGGEADGQVGSGVRRYLAPEPPPTAREDR
jgi:hypothetical protein